MNFPCREVASLPPYERLFGPVTQAKIARLLLLYLATLTVGSLFVFLSNDATLQIFGLGLILPGGGFLAHADICTQSGIGHLAAALLALSAFALSLLIWFGTGNILAPPLVWLGAAIWAAGMRHGDVWPSAIKAAYGVVGLVFAATGLILLMSFTLARRQRRIDNAYLSSQTRTLDAIFTAAPAYSTQEMSLEDLQRLRFALDRALQLVEQFSGFECLDQF